MSCTCAEALFASLRRKFSWLKLCDKDWFLMSVVWKHHSNQILPLPFVLACKKPASLTRSLPTTAFPAVTHHHCPTKGPHTEEREKKPAYHSRERLVLGEPSHYRWCPHCAGEDALAANIIMWSLDDGDTITRTLWRYSGARVIGFRVSRLPCRAGCWRVGLRWRYACMHSLSAFQGPNSFRRPRKSVAVGGTVGLRI